jgi:hypothetical protein
MLEIKNTWIMYIPEEILVLKSNDNKFIKYRILIIFILILVVALQGCQKYQSVRNGQLNNEVIPIPQEAASLPKETKKIDNEYNPIVVNMNMVIGGFSNGSWVEKDEIYPKIKDGDSFDIYSFDKFIGKGLGSIAKSQEDISDGIIDITNDTNDNMSEYIAIKSNWNALPRTPIKQNNNAIYEKDIIEMLKDNGISDSISINITQNIKVDLDGDGTDEVLINAENVSPINGNLTKNSYSILFLRKIVNGKVENLYIAKDIIPSVTEETNSAAIAYKVLAILDFNGDGKMEILVRSEYIDGTGYLLYGVEENEIKLLLSYIVGA